MADSALSPDQGVANDRVDQSESLDPVGMILCELDGDLRPETMSDQEGSRVLLRIEQQGQVPAPDIEFQSAAIQGLAIAPHVGSQEVPRFGESGRIDELRPSGVIAGCSMNHQDHRGGLVRGPPQPVAERAAVRCCDAAFHVEQGKPIQSARAALQVVHAAKWGYSDRTSESNHRLAFAGVPS